jgi:hypothetical protein
MNNCPEAGVFRTKKTVTTKTSELVTGACIVIVFVLGCYTGSVCSNKWSTMPLKQQAIEKGFAQWQVIDQQQGTTEFVWKQIDLSNKSSEYIATTK